jgi:hypothetical protein
MNEDRSGEGHPTAEDMAAYLDGRIGESARKRVEAHAAGCAECRREIAEVTAVLAPGRRTPGWRVWASAAAAAAVIALLVVGPFGMESEPDSAARFRGPGSAADRGGPVRIPVASPAHGSAVGPDGLTFVWHAGGSGASYQLTLTNDEGGVVWQLGTTDTVASLPDTIDLEPASTYHWYVDALLEGGRNATSGVRSFTTRR